MCQDNFEDKMHYLCLFLISIRRKYGQNRINHVRLPNKF